MFNRKLITTLVSAAVISGFAMNANAADGTGNASATIVAPLTVTENAAGSMNFGSVSPDFTNATTVVLTPAGAVSSGDGAGLVPASGARAGLFDVTGADLAYDITLPAVASTLTSGAFSMTVDTFTSSAASGVISGGTDSFTVGATLNVGADQDPNGGTPYTGTYTVTVTYQ